VREESEIDLSPVLHGICEEGLTDNNADDQLHAWNAEETRIPFESTHLGSLRDIWRMTVDGTNQFNLTNSASFTDANASWQPN
jgi:hypothetical protein